MSADDARLTERSVWDASGMERIPFDGRTPAPADSRIRSTSTPSRPIYPAALLRRLGVSPANRHSSACSGNPEVGCVCDYEPGDEPGAIQAEGYERAGKVTAGQEVAIYSDVRVTVLSVERYSPTDSFEPSTPWVTLRYQSGTYADGGPIVGQTSLPASQCLRVFG